MTINNGTLLCNSHHNVMVSLALKYCKKCDTWGTNVTIVVQKLFLKFCTKPFLKFVLFMYRSGSPSHLSDRETTVVTYVKKNVGMKSKNKVQAEGRYFHTEIEPVPLPDSEGDSGSESPRSPGSPSPPPSVTDSEKGSDTKQHTPKNKDKGKKTSEERVYGPNSPTGKRHVNDWTLAAEVEAKAVPWLESHDILWDKRHPKKNRKDLIDETWEEMAREFPPYTG